MQRSEGTTGGASQVLLLEGSICQLQCHCAFAPAVWHRRVLTWPLYWRLRNTSNAALHPSLRERQESPLTRVGEGLSLWETSGVLMEAELD